MFRLLGSGPSGLSPKVARKRLKQVGFNSIQDSTTESAMRLLLPQFGSPLGLILVFAAAVSLVVRELVEAVIDMAIVLASSLLAVSQEYRASRAVDALKSRLEIKARVLRGGREVRVPVRRIVPGDVIPMSAGNLVPADGVVVEAADFPVNEASMTGKSFPVEKRPGTTPPGTPVSGRTNAVFLGSSVRSGTAKVLAVRTGRATECGAIAATVAARPSETEFARGVRQFGTLPVRVMIVIVILVPTVDLARARPPVEALLFSVALAVGLSPELLPAILTVTPAAGARRLARGGVVVRRLDAIETLGSVDGLCTDKTGTLAEGRIVLSETLAPDGRPADDVMRLAFLNAAFETGIENPLEAAIVTAGKAKGLSAQGAVKIDKVPYDFQRRRLTIVVAEPTDPASHLIVTKGAFDNVLGVCRAIGLPDGDQPLDPPVRARAQASFQEKGEAGLRVPAIATRRVAARDRYSREDEEDMVFRGFLVFREPPKPDAEQTVRSLAALGIRVKIISGNNRHVTAHLASLFGLNPAAMLTGPKLVSLRDEALWHLGPQTEVFCKIDPQQKERIVRSLQRTGHAVGYLGDGVNDAPALHAAGGAFRSRPGHLVPWSTVVVGTAAFSAAYIGAFSSFLGFLPLPPNLFATLLGIVAAYGLVTEVTKAWFYRKNT